MGEREWCARLRISAPVPVGLQQGLCACLSESRSDSSGVTATRKASCGQNCCTESLSMGYFGHKAGNQGVRARARVRGAGRDRANEAAVDFGARERSPVDNFDMNETGIGGWGDGGGGVDSDAGARRRTNGSKCAGPNRGWRHRLRLRPAAERTNQALISEGK